jgi:hypothetical protein
LVVVESFSNCLRMSGVFVGGMQDEHVAIAIFHLFGHFSFGEDWGFLFRFLGDDFTTFIVVFGALIGVTGFFD